MRITAVYYVENSGPYNQYVVDVCDLEDKRFNDDTEFKSILWDIFEEEREAQECPKPDSDVVFLYTEQFRSSCIAAQMLNEDDTN